MKTKNITNRAIIIALFLIPLNVFWIIEVECVWHSGHPTTISLFWNVVFNLFVLILINLGLRKIWRHNTLTQAELITIYTMLSMASGLAGHDALALLVPALPHAFWFATVENDWVNLIQPFLPNQLVVEDLNILRGFYEGDTFFYTPEIIKAWLEPTFWWTMFILALSTIMICLNIFVRKQWTEHERLSYPIIQLPLAITEHGGHAHLFKKRIFWLGFILAGLLDIWHGLAYFFPHLPDFTVRHDQRDWGIFFTSKPWSAIGWLPIPLYPFVIALGFLLPIDLSVSIWFFFVVNRLQRVIGSATGIPSPFPYLSEQSIGSWLMVAAAALWTTRKHLIGVIGTILKRPYGIDDSNEPIRYRTVLSLFVMATLFIVWFCLKIGMTLTIILPFFVFFYLFSLALTRIRAEIGPPAHEMAFGVNAQNFLVKILGTRMIGPRNLSIFPLFWFFSGRGYREHIMPHQLESYKMAERSNMNTKKLTFVMLLAIIVGSIASFWAIVSELYRLGGAVTGDGGGIGSSIAVIYQFDWLENLLIYPRETDLTAIIFMLAGGIFTLALILARMKFMWWPLHPAGYALSTGFGVEYFWSCLIISSMLKWFFLKLGGVSSYRQAILLFFGVILGEYCVGAFWSVLSVVIGQPIYDFAPG